MKYVRLRPSANILIVAPHIFGYVGGAEKIICQLHEFFEKKEWRVILLTNDDLVNRSLNYNFNFDTALSPISQTAMLKKFEEADIIIACGFATLMLLYHYGVRKRVVFIPFETAKAIDEGKRRFCQKLLRSLNITTVLVFSRYFKELIKTVFSNEAIWIRYNLPKSEQIPSNTFIKTEKGISNTVFVPTRISPRKNLEDIVKIAEGVIHLEIDFVVSGGLLDTPYSNYAEKIRDMNRSCGSPVRFHERSISERDMGYFFSKCFCVVSASHIEGFGIFALEALNYLKTVLSYDSIGVREIATYGGLWSKGVQIVDGVEAMIKRVCDIYNSGIDIGLKRHIFSSIKAYNEEYSFEKQLECTFVLGLGY